MKKETRIKIKEGIFILFCKDKDWLVFGKLTKHRDGSTSTSFTKTVTFSNLPEFRNDVKQHII